MKYFLKRHYRIINAMILISTMNFILSVSSFAGEPIQLSEKMSGYAIGLHLDILEDVSGELTIQDISAPESDTGFKWVASNKTSNNLGFATSVYWVRFSIMNPTDQDIKFYLIQEYPMIDHVDAYIPLKEGGYKVIKNGDGIRFDERNVEYRDPAFLISMPAEETLTYYVRYETTSSLNMPLVIYTQAEFIKKLNVEFPVLWIYYGLLISMVIYNLFIFISVKDINFLYYVLFISFYVLFQMTLNGLTFQYLWPGSIWWANNCLPLFICLAYSGGLQFARSFLDFKKTSPKLDKTATICLFLAFFGILLALFAPYRIAIIFATAYMANIIIFICGTFYLSLKGSRPATFFFASYAVWMFGIAFFALKAFGLLPHNFITQWSVQIGSSIQAILLATVLTDQINTLKNELQILNVNLENKVEERTKIAEKAARIKGEFLANMSHEIRTPMNAIIGFTNLALQGENANKKNDFLKKIRSASNSLLGIINDVLDFSKMEAGKLSISQTRFPLSQILDELHDIFAWKIAEKKMKMVISLDRDVPEVLIGDPFRLKQILINLTENAVKFSTTGQVKINIKKTVKANRDSQNRVKLQFSVQDSGIGMTNKQIRGLFKLFSQVDNSANRKYGGTGLGLAISKQLVEMMGGEIRVDSDYGKGSVFTFTAEFSLQTPSGNDDELPDGISETEGLVHIRGANILLVEDDKSNQEVATGLLESKGFNVTVAGNGKAAIECLLTNDRFDAILMDIQMAELDGYEVTRVIRKDNRYKTLPIIAMTAHAMEEEKEKCIDAGMNDHVSKPIDPQSLFSALVKWISPLPEQPVDQQIISQLSIVKENDVGIELPAYLPGLNVTSGLEKMGGKKSRYIKMLIDFKTKYTDFTDNLTIAIRNNQMDTVRQMIHTVKGASGNIGAETLHDITREIDQALKGNNIRDGVELKLSTFREAFHRVFDSIEQLVQITKSEKVIPIDDKPNIDNLLTILIKIDDMLSQFRPDSEYLLDTIKDDLIHAGFEAEVQRLAAEIENMEYKEAQAHLTILKDKLEQY